MCFRIIKLIVLSVTVSFASVTSAEVKNITEGMDKEQVDLYKDISGDLRCPTCTGLSILQSDAQFSIQMKEAVREQVELGKSKDEVMEFFTERYGLWILREPPSTGMHLFAWMIQDFFFLQVLYSFGHLSGENVKL